MNPHSYYLAIHTTIHTTSMIINHQVDINNYSGRAGSRDFEDKEVKSYIRKHHDTIVSQVNEALGEDIFLEYIDAQENSSESSERTMEDILVVFSCKEKDTTNIIKVPINIKCVSGKNADNVGGWAALNFVLYGDDKQSKKRKTLQRIIEQDFTQEPGDYFLWVFYKNKPSHAIVKDSALFSLLGTDSSAISVNPSQSFPLQFSSHKVSEEYLPVYTQQDLYQRRCNLVEKIATTMKQSYSKEEKLWDDILTKRSSKNVSTNNEQYHHLMDKLLTLDSQDEIVTYLGKENFFKYKKIFSSPAYSATVHVSP